MRPLHVHIVFESDGHTSQRAKFVKGIRSNGRIDYLRGLKCCFGRELKVRMHRFISLSNMIDARLRDLDRAECTLCESALDITNVHRGEVHAIHPRPRWLG